MQRQSRLHFWMRGCGTVLCRCFRRQVYGGARGGGAVTRPARPALSVVGLLLLSAALMTSGSPAKKSNKNNKKNGVVNRAAQRRGASELRRKGAH